MLWQRRSYFNGENLVMVKKLKLFTLLEAIFVILLIAIVATFGIKSYSTSKDSITQAEAVSNIDRVIASQLAWSSLSGDYSPDGSNLTDLKAIEILPSYTPSLSGDQVSMATTSDGVLLLAIQGFDECILFRVTPLIAGANRTQLPTTLETACAALSAVFPGEKLI